MIENALFFVAGCIVTVMVPPVFRYTAAKIAQVKAWNARRKQQP